MEQVLANHILGVSQTKKVYKFVIEDEFQNPFFQIQLTNWETWITTNAFRDSVGGELLFKLC